MSFVLPVLCRTRSRSLPHLLHETQNLNKKTNAQSAIFDKAMEHGQQHLAAHPGEKEIYGHLIKDVRVDLCICMYGYAHGQSTKQAVNQTLT